MKILKQVNKWISKYKNSFFFYRDGFFELPQLTNSPEALISTIEKMPFIKHNKGKQLITSKSPLVSGSFYYEKLEEGLWITQGDFEYKANILFKNANDKTMPSDCYFLTLKVYGIKQKNALINGVPYISSSWLLFKPNCWTTTCQFKGAKELTFTMLFNETWLRTILYKQPSFINSKLKSFFESESKYITCNDNFENTATLYKAIYTNFRKNIDRTNLIKTELKELVHKMFSQFMNIYDADNTNINLLDVADKDRKLINKVEKILLQNVLTTFPGVEQLASEAGMSLTKFKTTFHKIYGMPVFKYYRLKQMLLAKQLLQQNSLQVKEVAKIIGYQNTSKFSTAFKKEFGTLPSDIQQVILE